MSEDMSRLLCQQIIVDNRPAQARTSLPRTEVVEPV
jgi:hypothetical protein